MAPSVSPHVTASDTDPRERVNILVVDDRRAKLIAMEALLADLGENVVCVSSGADALRQLLERDFAVVLLDVNMPEMDGFETATLIRQRPRLRHIPIIFMTAGSDETHALQGYSLGAVDYILTPVVPEVLRTKVKVFVELFRMSDQLKRQADQRVALAEERAARATAEAARRRAAFLADAGNKMAQSLDLESTLTAILELIVPEVADRAVLRLQAAGGNIVSALPRGGDGELAVAPQVAEAMEGAVRSLTTQVVAETSGLEGGMTGLACPLLARGAPVGVLGVIFGSSPLAPDPNTIILIEDLCGRAAIALENCLLYREIQDRDVRKDQFVAMLAHELRNPLGIISSALGILETVGGHDEPSKKARGAVRRQLKNLTQLIDDLVDVSRITTGKITITRSPVNLKESVARCVEAFNAAGSNQAHSVQIQSRDTWIHADSVRIDQILTNLVENARKYTPPGGSIRIRVEPEGSDGVFEIEDTGAGMASDVLAHAFDLFFQGRRSPDQAEGGLGIGLTLVRQLVELHGGSILAGSPGEGRGSRFTARFPGCAPPVSYVAPTGAREARTGASRIVIVEDNEDARDLLKMLLALEGHEVHAAPDGPIGIETVETVDPEIAFIDLGLPGIDGYEVARRLRAGRGKDVFLVALSGYGQSEDRRRAIESGFNMHIVKPISPDRLASVIASLQERRLGKLVKESLDRESG